MIKKFVIEHLKIKSKHSIYIFSALVGALAGLATMAFNYLLDQADHLIRSLLNRNVDDNLSLVERVQHINDNIGNAILIVLVPTIGGAIAGLIAYYGSRDAGGTGTDEIINAFHNKEGQIKPKVPFLKAIATIFTVSSGGSGGKEGSVAQIGASIGVMVANLLNAGARARRSLLIAGTAAGLGAVFKAPLGGALTAAEMVYKEDIETDSLIPCFIASVTAYLVYVGFLGHDVIIHSGNISFFRPSELPFYLLLGMLCFLFGYLLIKGFNDAKALTNKIKIHRALKPAIGGLAVGIVSLIFWEVSGTGTTFLEQTLTGRSVDFFRVGPIYVIVSFFLIVCFKIFATTLTLGTGGSAGIFGPSLFIGGMLGAAVGNLAQFLLPDMQVQIPSYILVGMGAFYAGVASAPLAGIIMICEMSGTYILLPPIIIVSIFTFILSKKITFYKSQVENRFQSPAHHWDMKIDVIENVTISQRFMMLTDLSILQHTISFVDLLKKAREMETSDFVIIDKERMYKGMLSLRKVDTASVDVSENGGRIDQLIDSSIPGIDYNASLGAALKVMMDHDVDKAAVLINNKVLGYVRVKDIFTCYLEMVKSKRIVTNITT